MTDHADAASRYTPAPDLGIVTCYFNAHGYRTRRANYERFVEAIRRSGLELVTVECAFGEAPFDLSPAPGVLRVRARDIMWQKERLLNLGLATLPRSCAKAAWLDCDVLFANPDWAAETSKLLERYAVVQTFERAVRLPRGEASYRGSGDVWPGFASVVAIQPDSPLTGRFDRHGHTGFGWAASREIVARHGLYDACIAGSGDHMMAHAFCGDWESKCVERILGGRNRHLSWFAAWGRRIYPDIRARVGFVSGTLLHLWHGETLHRRYVDRNRELAGFDFDPASDLRVDPCGCWEWASDKPELHRWAVGYFGQRKEDGESEELTAERSQA